MTLGSAPTVAALHSKGADARAVKALQAGGATSLRAIAEGHNAQGIPTARGQGKWSAVQVVRSSGVYIRHRKPNRRCRSAIPLCPTVVIMPIKFTPRRGQILMCDYDRARVPPEMEKVRRVVVLSPRSYNHPHGSKPGRCIVVPFSATDPEKHLTPADVPFPAGVYLSLTTPTWAICSAVMSVSHDRLDRVFLYRKRQPGRFLMELLSQPDLNRIEIGLSHAIGTA